MKNPNLTLAVIAATASIILTGVAFWLSYEHLHDVAHAHGLADQARAWAWPATVDLFVIIGEVLMLRVALAGRTDAWAIFLTVAGSGGSIGLNVAGVGTEADRLDYVVAAVPPVAALLAFGAIMRQIHGLLADRVAAQPAKPVAPPVAARLASATPAAISRPVVAASSATPAAARSATPAKTPTVPATATPQPTTAAPATGGPDYEDGTPQHVVRALWLRLGHRPTEGQIVDALGAAELANSRAQAGKIRRQVEAENSALPGPRAA